MAASKDCFLKDGMSHVKSDDLFADPGKERRKKGAAVNGKPGIQREGLDNVVRGPIFCYACGWKVSKSPRFQGNASDPHVLLSNIPGTIGGKQSGRQLS